MVHQYTIFSLHSKSYTCILCIILSITYMLVIFKYLSVHTHEYIDIISSPARHKSYLEHDYVINVLNSQFDVLKKSK